MRNTRTQQRRPTLEFRLDIFLDLSGVPQGRVPRGRSMLCYRLCYMILLHDICYRTFSLLHAKRAQCDQPGIRQCASASDRRLLQ